MPSAVAGPEIGGSRLALCAQLASGFNALSPTGDYREIDVYAKEQQQALCASAASWPHLAGWAHQGI